MLLAAGYPPEAAPETGAQATGEGGAEVNATNSTTTTETKTDAPAGSTDTVTEAAATAAATTHTDDAAAAPQEGAVTVRDISNPDDNTNTNPEDTDLDDAKVLAYLSKKTGKEITSLDSVIAPAATSTEPSEEEKRKMQEQFDNDAIKYALDKNIFDTKTLAAYNADKARDAREIALKVFADEQIALDPDLAERLKTDRAGVMAELDERFQDAFFEHEEENDWRRKRGQQQMQRTANEYINNKYGNVLGAGDAYEAELQTQHNAVGYKSKVEKVFAELPQQLTTIIDNKEFSYNVPETSRTAIREEFLKSETFRNLGEGNIEEPALRQTMEMAVFKMEQSKFIAEVAKAYAANQIAEIKMGRKNIPVYNEEAGSTINGNLLGEPSKAREMLARANPAVKQ